MSRTDVVCVVLVVVVLAATSMMSLAYAHRCRVAADRAKARVREVIKFAPYARYLGRECVITDEGHSYLARCVAVGWHGAIQVRGETLRTGDNVWIRQRNVRKVVRWL